jgi:hypothetical protein
MGQPELRDFLELPQKMGQPELRDFLGALFSSEE